MNSRPSPFAAGNDMGAIHALGGQPFLGHGRSSMLPFVLVLFAALHAAEALASGVGNLDADSRRAVREAQMSRFGGRTQGGSAEYRDRSGVAVQNDARGRRTNCTTQVGQVNSQETRRGNRIQQVTVVEGNVVNVCD